MPYRASGPDGLELLAPVQNDLRSRAVVRTSIGIGGGAGQAERFNLEGTYVYECNPTQATFWDRGPDGLRRANPMVLARAP